MKNWLEESQESGDKEKLSIMMLQSINYSGLSLGTNIIKPGSKVKVES